MRRRTLIIREFLNTPFYHAGAYVYLHIPEDGDGELSIADCRKTITLPMEVGDEGFRANTLFKLKLLRKTIDRAIRYIEKL